MCKKFKKAYSKADSLIVPKVYTEFSTKETLDMIREAKKKTEKQLIFAEATPHHIALTEEDTIKYGTLAKMNPPLRSKEDREALITGIQDGTIDMIATDHAPHSAEEKAKGLEGSAFGIVGLETAFPLLYTELVLNSKIITLSRLVDLMSTNPRERFNIPLRPDDYAIWELDESFVVDPEKFLSMGRATPFAGRTLYGVIKETVYGGNKVYG